MGSPRWGPLCLPAIGAGCGLVIHSSTRPRSTLCPSVPGPICSRRHFLGDSSLHSMCSPAFAQPLQRGDSPFSQMRKQVQRGQAQGYSLSKWPIQNSSEVWLRSAFMAPVSLGPPAGVGWNSKGSWGCKGSPGTRYLLCWLCPDNSAFLSFPAQHSLGATFGSERTSRLFTHFPCYRRPSNPAASLRPCDLGQVPVLLPVRWNVTSP